MPARRLIVTALTALVTAGSALAGGLDVFSDKDASAGLRQALSQGAEAAVSQLGRKDGFYGNPKLQIPLPEGLRRAESVMRLAGKGGDIDALHAAINHAAEDAVSQALPLLTTAVKQMTVSDAKAIITGGDDSVTRYFRSKTAEPLAARFTPTVKQATARIGLAQQYNALAGTAAGFGLVKAEDADIDRYVTRKALDGLYSAIGEEERAIRQNPASAAGALAKKIFGAL